MKNYWLDRNPIQMSLIQVKYEYDSNKTLFISTTVLIQFKAGADEDICLVYLQRLLDKHCALEAGQRRIKFDVMVNWDRTVEVNLVDEVVYVV